ncbi:hypothetical protein CC79DRAFT_1367409 [Sarocladium strictum]
MAFATGMFGTFGDSDKVITACRELSIFIIDAYELRSGLSRIRISLTPEPSQNANSTNVYSFKKTPGLREPYQLSYNCRHDQTTSVNNCQPCDNGTVLLKTPPIDRLMFSSEVMHAMKWLSAHMAEVNATGTVRVAEGISRAHTWWIDHPELNPYLEGGPKPPIVRSPLYGADRTPVAWCLWRGDMAVLRKIQAAADEANTTTGNSSSPGDPSPQSSPHTANSEGDRTHDPSTRSDGSRPGYWDPVYDSHEANIHEERPWPDPMPFIPLFPFRWN